MFAQAPLSCGVTGARSLEGFPGEALAGETPASSSSCGVFLGQIRSGEVLWLRLAHFQGALALRDIFKPLEGG